MEKNNVSSKDWIIVKGARENNLKNVDVAIPKGSLTVFTGVSGSGKSTLAFDTIFSEGQRRYVESLSSYARQFLGGFEKPDVDSIEGLSPAISIDQKSTSHNPRSTVGTVTEIYDYLRLLYARVGVPYCPNHHTPIKSFSPVAMANAILAYPQGTKIQILSPVVRDEKGTHADTIDKLKKQGFSRIRIDGNSYVLPVVPELEKNKRHSIDIVIDRLICKEGIRERVLEDVELALDWGHGYLSILTDEGERLLSSKHCCSECGFSIPSLEPRLFSFNAPLGYCPDCKGLGIKREVSLDLLVPDQSKTIAGGAIRYLSGIVNTPNIEWKEFEYLCNTYSIPLDVPFADLSKKQKDIILYGSPDRLDYVLTSSSGNKMNRHGKIEGIKTRIERLYRETSSDWMRQYYESFMRDSICTTCHGARLNQAALSVKVNGLNIYEATCLSLERFLCWIDEVPSTLDEEGKQIASLIIKELRNRAQFLVDVGLEYLTLSRYAMTLSGGESQRIRLATQIGSRLSGVLYVLDEPSIGLHQRDNDKLIATLKEMRDLGNTLIVVEHDEDMMRAADYIVDVGPLAGRKGGRIVAAGSFDDILHANSITADYLTGRRRIEIPEKLRPGNGKSLIIRGARGNNLKNVDVEFPLGKLICVTGVSGSGKSTLVNETLRPILSKLLYRSYDQPLDYDSVEGTEHIDKLVVVDQAPIGRSPRSNPATYSNVFSDIRKLFESTPDAQIRGFKAGRFSFNVKGGRCEECRGAGVQTIEMNFLPDVYVTCKACGGHRYNRETLEVKYKGKNIDDVLNMTVNMAVEFFANIPSIHQKLKAIQDVGLGYLTLGQPCTTLSGGESQRIKLSSELSKRDTGRTLYILDEPTTGLHFEDIRQLLDVLAKLVDRGNTVIVIEHNLDVIKVADHLIDIGPEGGEEGGRIVATGTPAEVARCPESYTGRFLQKLGL